ncbi:glycosyl transferase family 2 [Pseudogulbenkiania ferrooxidans 2002]|uniref:Glycosyl transferase family 2 n=2 Tax=Pseudogulbenkiania ferrooxidans TaxID=549169 RepID=B9YZ87_9NEIS|nr:glycosyl transferase family 2 [Pseudogulbenkiania ferrooxidans 2002]
MPCFNGERYLEHAIKSFLNQSYQEKQLIIVDGKSTDGSHTIINAYSQNNPSIVWVKRKDKGISHAINMGINEIENDAIFGYMGVDDILMPHSLETVATLLFDFSMANAAFFDSFTFERNGRFFYRNAPVKSVNTKTLVKYGTIAGLQNFYCDAEIVKKLLFLEKKKYAMDFDFYFRAASKGILRAVCAPQASTVNIQDGNISTKFFRMGHKERLDSILEIQGMSMDYAIARLKFWISKLKSY